MKKLQSDPALDQRRAGVLLHPSSLPGPQRIGNIGAEARNFLHFMSDCGLTVWQMLPLGPTHADGSPYQCLSAHAGNPELISLEWLQQHSWLKPNEVQRGAESDSVQPLLNKAAERFFARTDAVWLQQFEEFLKLSSYWLDDYALFIALKQAYQESPWTDWPLCYRFRDPDSLTEASQQYADTIKSIQFTQFVFFRQWHELRDYARSLNIRLFGDMPIYVALDSADVWSQKENFLMHRDGNCDFVAGVPPDAFSDNGQLWGNPLYDWNFQKQHDFAWWKDRFRSQLDLFDLIRIDHFRGLQACWQIPADALTAKDGKWVKTPGKALLSSLNIEFHTLPLIAEDLGFITAEVKHLRDEFDLPGMSVLQFAFDGQVKNPYLPHNHIRNTVVYTGTHDNDTTLGWYQTLDERGKKQLHDYIGLSEFTHLNMPWDMIRMALVSPAKMAILPLQDLLALDSSHRMNTPGTTLGNWSWRFDWSQVWPGLPRDLYYMVNLYGRLAASTDQ